MNLVADLKEMQEYGIDFTKKFVEAIFPPDSKDGRLWGGRFYDDYRERMYAKKMAWQILSQFGDTGTSWGDDPEDRMHSRKLTLHCSFPGLETHTFDSLVAETEAGYGDQKLQNERNGNVVMVDMNGLTLRKNQTPEQLKHDWSAGSGKSELPEKKDMHPHAAFLWDVIERAQDRVPEGHDKNYIYDVQLMAMTGMTGLHADNDKDMGAGILPMMINVACENMTVFMKAHTRAGDDYKLGGYWVRDGDWSAFAEGMRWGFTHMLLRRLSRPRRLDLKLADPHAGDRLSFIVRFGKTKDGAGRTMFRKCFGPEIDEQKALHAATVADTTEHASSTSAQPTTPRMTVYPSDDTTEWTPGDDKHITWTFKGDCTHIDGSNAYVYEAMSLKKNPAITLATGTRFKLRQNNVMQDYEILAVGVIRITRKTKQNHTKGGENAYVV